ncbi:MAG: DNA lyase [Archaeoglobus sp.]|nr:MAG: DNA lyase [Archaeoglobus sp.]
MLSNTELLNRIQQRIKEFERLGEGTTFFDFRPFLDLKLKATIKGELLFCISTANSSARSGLVFQSLLEPKLLGSIEVNKEELEKLMRLAGVRFYRKKSRYAVKALKNFNVVKTALKKDSLNAREYLVKKIDGIGYKEASHFLRNVGRKDVAILDRHVVGWIYDKLYDKLSFDSLPKTLTSKKYRILEETLREIARIKGITLAELDLLLWYEKTGKVLK